LNNLVPLPHTSSPNTRLARVLAIINAPLTVIAICGMVIESFMLGVASDKVGAGLSLVLIGIGLWLEYRYYSISVKDFDIKSEKIAWVISIFINLLTAFCWIVIPIAAGLKIKDIVPCLIDSTYPSGFLIASTKAWFKLKQIRFEAVGRDLQSSR
jgi:hypothetical protein